MVDGTCGKWKLLVAGLLMLAVVPAMASSPMVSNEQSMAVDSAGLIQLEIRADNAKPREQCYLYTQLVSVLLDAASLQVAAGEGEAAGKTVVRIAGVTAKLQRVASRDAKRLKEAEKMLNETSRRLKDLSRVAGSEEREGMHMAQEKLDAAHAKILNLVFMQ